MGRLGPAVAWKPLGSDDNPFLESRSLDRDAGAGQPILISLRNFCEIVTLPLRVSSFPSLGYLTGSKNPFSYRYGDQKPPWGKWRWPLAIPPWLSMILSISTTRITTSYHGRLSLGGEGSDMLGHGNMTKHRSNCHNWPVADRKKFRFIFLTIVFNALIPNTLLSWLSDEQKCIFSHLKSADFETVCDWSMSLWRNNLDISWCDNLVITLMT